MWCLYVLEKVGFCNSSPVKCSQLFGNYFRLKNIIFFDKFLYLWPWKWIWRTWKFLYYLAIVLIIFTAFLPTLIKVVPVWPGKPTTTYPLLKIRLVPVLRNVGSTIGQVYRERICMNKHFGAHSNKSIRNAVLRRHRRRRRRCCCFLLQ